MSLTRWESEKEGVEDRNEDWEYWKGSERSPNLSNLSSFNQIKKLKHKLAKCLALNII